MIERLPLHLFDDEPDQSNEAADIVIDQAPDESLDVEIPIDSPAIPDSVPLARCQWCAEEFDDRLSNCPACGVVHRIALPVNDETAATICQWCQAGFEPGSTRCPECGAMVVVPGQYVLGQDDPDSTLLSRSLMAKRAQSNQILVGMMLGGGLDNLIGGLIGLAITLIDED